MKPFKRSSRSTIQWSGALLCVALAAGVAGCSEITSGSAVREDLSQVRQDLNALTLGIHRTKSETDTLLAQLDRRSREQTAEIQRQFAALQVRTEAISQELARIGGKLDEIQHRLDGGVRQPAAKTPPLPQSATPQSTPTTPRPGPGSRTPPTPDTYQLAYIDFTKGNYSLAIAGFQEFLRRFPDVDLADNAQYWIGESYFSLARAHANQGDQEKSRQALEQGVQEFRKVLLTYPRGDKVPTALYKEALALFELKQGALAEGRLRYLIENFPQSEEAPLARERLAALKGPTQ